MNLVEKSTGKGEGGKEKGELLSKTCSKIAPKIGEQPVGATNNLSNQDELSVVSIKHTGKGKTSFSLAYHGTAMIDFNRNGRVTSVTLYRANKAMTKAVNRHRRLIGDKLK